MYLINTSKSSSTRTESLPAGFSNSFETVSSNPLGIKPWSCLILPQKGVCGKTFVGFMYSKSFCTSLQVITFFCGKCKKRKQVPEFKYIRLQGNSVRLKMPYESGSNRFTGF